MKRMTEIMSEGKLSNGNLTPDERAVYEAVKDLTEWALKHHTVLMHGRHYGFELGASKDVLDGMRITANDGSLHNAKHINGAVSNIGNFSWSEQNTKMRL